MRAPTSPACGMRASYVGEARLEHSVQMRQIEAQTWEIVDVPKLGEEPLLDRLGGELECAATAVAVAQDYPGQTARRAG